jgi:hypothetical protein
LCSCRILLCLRLCRSAVGANWGSLVRNTAVPWHDGRRLPLQAAQQGVQRHLGAARLAGKDIATAPPSQDQQIIRMIEPHVGGPSFFWTPARRIQWVTIGMPPSDHHVP